MIRAVFFDLDNTLLGNDMEVFMPSYIQALTQFASRRIPPVTFMRALGLGIDAMNRARDDGSSNAEAFWEAFGGPTGLSRSEQVSFFEPFFSKEHGALASLVQSRPSAHRAITACVRRNLPVTIATNSVFPLAAIEARLTWAGLSPRDFEFQLVTSYERMHSTKPHLSYYEEMLRITGHRAPSVLMVGNDVEQDIEPARRCGLQTFHVTDDASAWGPDAGTLEHVCDRLERL